MIAKPSFFIFFFLTLFTYLFLAELGLHSCKGFFSSYGEWGLLSSRGVWASLCGGFSCCRAQALGHSDFSSCGSWALEHRLKSCGTQAYLFCGMWDLSRSRIKLMSPALAGRFFTTEPPGKPAAGGVRVPGALKLLPENLNSLCGYLGNEEAG